MALTPAVVLHQGGYWTHRALTDDMRTVPLLAISAAATAAAIAYDQHGWRRPRGRRSVQR